jgi:toxin ParE1/3/4
MANVYYQAKADRDLDEVWFEIAQDSLRRADAYIEQIHETCELIAENPRMGVERPDLDEDVRSFPVDRYVIFYEIIPDGIVILRVWHTARDPKDFIA